MSFTPAEKLVDLIDNFIDYVYNNIETLYGAENENEHEPIAIPRQFYARGIGSFSCMIASNFNTYWWGYGGWSLLYEYDITCSDGNVNLSGWTKLGRYKKGTWDAIHPYSGGTPNADEGDNILTEYVEEHNYPEIIKKTYPSDPVSANYGLDAYNNPSVNFDQFIGGAWSGSGLYNTYQLYNSLSENANPRIQYGDYRTTFSEDGVYVDTPYQDPFTCYANTLCVSYKDSMLVTQTNDDTYINKYITNNAAEHNYNYTYETENGDEITVYYGDNYVIYKCNDDTQITYDDNYNIINKIKDDTDLPVENPTYREKKYGPVVDPDDDIEVEMPLNDAAYGAGLSHYYVTTVGSTVLEDISAAMSTWDIKNTGKDLYRNLISCRITKVGPIPSESSTFVIYGEELQYNGSPITITKITGNPSMDLGEYEVLPKFNDFRDYAPFTKIEMFIPYCGWVSLPSHCMSSEDKPKIITGTLLCDIIAGTCKAVIKCNDTVIAEASGFTAIDVPFTGENVGMKMAGIANSITSYGNQAAKTVGSVASGGMSGGAGAGAALAGGLVGIAGSYAQMYSAFNANYTEICGKTGDGCNVAGLNKVYIKIQRPKAGDTESPYYVPANYAHTTGFMSMKQKQISECDGLIVCANVDTSGISGATARERAEIKRLLETGIYVNLTPPEPPEP